MGWTDPSSGTLCTASLSQAYSHPVAYPGVFFGGGGSTNSVEDRGRGSGGGSPLVRGSGGSCNLVQGILFHILKFSQFLVLQTIYDDN